MAKENAKNIYSDLDNETLDKLSEIYGGVLDAIQKDAVSEQIKNKNYSGNPTSGSVEIKRFVNATLSNYGTARTNGKGSALENNSVIINVDTDKEIVEELADKDIALYGVADLVGKRAENQKKRLTAYLDTQFFAKAVSEGTSFTFTGETIQDKMEEIVQSIETKQNDFVDGVDRDMIVLSVKPSVYGKLRNYIDSIPNPTNGVDEKMFHGVRIYSNHRQTKDVICMIDGAVAQLVKIDEYTFEKVPFANAHAVELFVSTGTKAVMPDLIAYADLEVASV